MAQFISSVGAGRSFRGVRKSYIQEALIALFNRIEAWQERHRTRSHLYRMPDYILQDIGVSRSEVETEFSKPFWKP